MKKNWLEWTVFAVSLALVSATLGYLIFDAATLGSDPPLLEVRLGTPERRSEHYVVPVTVFNHGDRAVEVVRIAVTLERDGEERERTELDFDYLARHAHRVGWVAFETDPGAADRVVGRVLGYLEP